RCMADVTSIIEAELGKAFPDGFEGEEELQTPPEPTAAVEEPPVESKPVEEPSAKVESKPETEDDGDLDKDLDALGTAPKPGQRVNRIPQTRVVKMVKHAEARLAKKHQEELKRHLDRVTEMERQMENYSRADHLIGTDPARYLQMLAM